jgi:6-pyruvoyltetrahydropterin/6-carboxytetrahydropterin synthase
VECCSKELNENGMVVDFTHIKHAIIDKLDHAILNDVVDFNPTAENLAKWIVDTIPNCFKCEVQESEGNSAIYIKD